MKKLIAFILAVTFLAVTVGCSAEQPAGDQPELTGLTELTGQDYSDSEAVSASSFPQPDEPEKADWGITLSAENVTTTGMTLVCSQSGGKPTGKLQCGSAYSLLEYSGGEWNAVPCLLGEAVWTMEAYALPQGGKIKFELDWVDLYGELPAGIYRIEKEFIDFRGGGDYDTETYCTEFGIVE